MTTARPSRRTIELVAAIAVIVVSISAAIASLFVQYVNARALDAKNRTDEIAGCRATYRVDYLDAPTGFALLALARDDRPGYRRAVEKLRPDAYSEVVRRSVTDPDRFLRECRAHVP